MRAKKNLEAANNELEINLDNALKVGLDINTFFASLEVTYLMLCRNETEFRFVVCFGFLGQRRIPEEPEEVATASEGW